MSDQTALSFATRSAPADGVAVVFAGEGPKLTHAAQDLDKKSKGLLAKAAEITGFKGKKDQLVDLIAPQGLKFARVVLAGIDKTASFGQEDWLNLGGSVRGLLTGKEAPVAHVFLESGDGKITGADAASFALGALLRGYKFKKYKTKAKKKNGAAAETNDRTLKKIVVHCDDPKAANQAFVAARAIFDGVTLARDLVNEPANVLGPAEFAARAKGLTKSGVQVEVLGPKALQRLGMNALLAVGQGSDKPSHVVVMQWRGAGPKGGAPIALVGKGVTFDTGGISLKPAAGMEDMKGDMGGAACVVGLDAGARRAQGEGERRRHHRPRREHAERARPASGRRRHGDVRDRPSRCSTPTPKGAWSLPIACGTCRSASSQRRSSISRR